MNTCMANINRIMIKMDLKKAFKNCFVVPAIRLMIKNAGNIMYCNTYPGVKILIITTKSVIINFVVGYNLPILLSIDFCPFLFDIWKSIV